MRGALVNVFALAFALVACRFGDNEVQLEIDAGPSGYDPEISACCDWFLLPGWYEHPERCLRDHTAPGECRWLSCLGGLVEYNACR